MTRRASRRPSLAGLRRYYLKKLLYRSYHQFGVMYYNNTMYYNSKSMYYNKKLSRCSSRSPSTQADVLEEDERIKEQRTEELKVVDKEIELEASLKRMMISTASSAQDMSSHKEVESVSSKGDGLPYSVKIEPYVMSKSKTFFKELEDSFPKRQFYYSRRVFNTSLLKHFHVRSIALSSLRRYHLKRVLFKPKQFNDPLYLTALKLHSPIPSSHLEIPVLTLPPSMEESIEKEVSRTEVEDETMIKNKKDQGVTGGGDEREIRYLIGKKDENSRGGVITKTFDVIKAEDTLKNGNDIKTENVIVAKKDKQKEDSYKIS